MAAPLQHIEIRGFKSIRECALDLRPLTLLIGGNGSGKSNFVQVFGLLHEVVVGRLQAFVQRQGGPECLLHFGQKTTERIEIGLRFGQNAYRLILAPTQADSLFIDEELCYFWLTDHAKPYEEGIGTAQLESQLQSVAKRRPGRVASYVLESLSSWRVYHFHDTSQTAKVKQLCDIDDNAVLRQDAANLAPFLWRLRDTAPAQYAQIVSTIRDVAPFFHDFQLRALPLSPGKTRLEWHERGSDTYFNAHSLSDGTLRFICLATLLLQPNLPATVLLDEPELGLHPYAIQILAGLLRAASHRTQVIVSTQSVTLVNQFEPADIVVVERSGGASTFRRANESEVSEWLDDYGLGELWEKNVLGGRPSA
ncbi:MAG TPA: AAA family ATPase [Polyangiaceae bacterium]